MVQVSRCARSDKRDRTFSHRVAIVRPLITPTALIMWVTLQSIWPDTALFSLLAVVAAGPHLFPSAGEREYQSHIRAKGVRTRVWDELIAYSPGYLRFHAQRAGWSTKTVQSLATVLIGLTVVGWSLFATYSLVALLMSS